MAQEWSTQPSALEPILKRRFYSSYKDTGQLVSAPPVLAQGDKKGEVQDHGVYQEAGIMFFLVTSMWDWESAPEFPDLPC